MMIFKAKDLQDAKEKIISISKCKQVNDIPMPSASTRFRYLICDNGSIFCLKECNDGIFITERNREKKIPKDGKLRVRLCFNKKEYQLELARLVWCAFNSGVYDEDIVIAYKNNNPLDVRLDNLKSYGKPKYKKLPDFSGLTYSLYFKDYCNYCERLYYGIDKEDAKDIVSNTFLEVVDKSDCAEKLRIVWKMYIKKRVLDYFYRKCKHETLEDRIAFTYDKGIEIDLSAFCHRKTERETIRLMLDGYSIEDISEMKGVSRSTIRSHICRGTKEIQEKIKHPYH